MPQVQPTDTVGFTKLMNAISKKNLQKLPNQFRIESELYKWWFKGVKIGVNTTASAPTFTIADSPALTDIVVFLNTAGHLNQAAIRTALKRTYRARRARILFKYGKRIADL